MLLGRPWIHTCQVCYGGQCGNRKKETLFITKPAAFSHIGAAEEAIETFFRHSLENAQKMCEAWKMVARFMLNSPYVKGKGQKLATNIRPIRNISFFISQSTAYFLT
jgi:hypothetical protein